MIKSIVLKRGKFYKVRMHPFDKHYCIICPNEDKEVNNSIWDIKYLGCIFFIDGIGKRSYLCCKKGDYVPSARINDCIKPLTRRDYMKVQTVLKKYHYIFNKKTCSLIDKWT